ncbi:M48 family metallopeptidase [Thiomicrorhabdus xiamenensis]|uniref:M48 family metallopeptidase n=1 Tax=Thiomicrorhabdus xiamenensis TaxID=2739063 RepID=A0A7D4SI26_9GAMM|nr:M48 family metallopeptidase [Thiomicrorhabdus xiamenensis]QKI88079.1 M48 family metallopeptidase [Thiomicrorhabdus xiamenensis]
MNLKLSKPLLFSLAIFVGAGQLSGCGTTTTKKGEVGVERKQILLVSEEQMVASSEKAYSNVIGEAEKERKLNTNAKLTQRVRLIANRLIPQTAVFRADAPRWNWEVNVLESDQLNAWCMPGGKIAFYTGIIEKLNLTDAEIAAIMGHEMAHALREHGRERASQQVLQNTGLNILGAATGMGQVGMDLTALAMQVTLTLPNSRTHETESDRIGVELAARGGYDPYAAITLWQKMDKATQGGKTPELLSTHPSHSTRIQDLQKYAKKVYPLYLSAKKRYR